MKVFENDINVSGVINEDGRVGVMIAFNTEGNVGVYPRAIVSDDFVPLLLSDTEARSIAELLLSAAEG